MKVVIKGKDLRFLLQNAYLVSVYELALNIEKKKKGRESSSLIFFSGKKGEKED